MSSAESRNRARDYWNTPSVIRAAHILDWAMAGTFTLALAVIGSLNF